MIAKPRPLDSPRRDMLHKAMENPWKTVGEGLLLTVRLTPKGGRDRIEGIVTDADGRPAIKARVSAPPVNGAANKALLKLLAKELGVPKSAVRFHSGETARIKRLLIVGAGVAEIDVLKQKLA